MRTLALAATVTVLGSVGVFAALHPSGVDPGASVKRKPQFAERVPRPDPPRIAPLFYIAEALPTSEHVVIWYDFRHDNKGPYRSAEPSVIKTRRVAICAGGVRVPVPHGVATVFCPDPVGKRGFVNAAQ